MLGSNSLLTVRSHFQPKNQLNTIKYLFAQSKQIVLSAACFIIVGTICGCSGSSTEDYSAPRDLLAEQKYAETIDLCNEKIKSSPADSGFFAYRAIAECRLEKLELAQADLLKAIELNGNQGWYYRELGSVYLKQRKYREALQSLTKAQKMLTDSDNAALILSSLAVAHLRLGEPEKALAETNEALKMAPQQTYSYVTRAGAYSELNELEKALSDVNKSLEMDNKNPLAYITRGGIYYQMGDSQKAIADSQTALSLNKKFWQAIELQSAMNLATGNFDEALKKANQLIEQYPDAAVGFSAKASCLFAKGDFIQAQKLADKAVAVEPESHRAILIGLMLAARSGDKSKVNQLIERLPTSGIDKQRLAKDRATASLFLKDYPKAVEILSVVIERGGKDPNAYRLRSEAYRRMHKSDLADADMKKALRDGYTKVNILEQYFKVL